MKNKKLKIISVILIIFTLIFSVSCSKSEPKVKSDKILIYCTDGTVEWYKGLFNTYNSYCASMDGLDTSYQVDYVTFDDETQLYNKMSTEIMAGGGPDVFLTDEYLPFEKMIEARLFADVDEIFEENNEKLEKSKLNKDVLNSGVFDGKRYIVPLLFTPKAHIASKYVLEQLNMPTAQNSVITYGDSGFFENLLKNCDKYEISPSQGYDASLISNIICDYVDFDSKKIDFNSREFKNILDTAAKLVKAGERNNKDSENFRESLFSSELNSFYDLQISFFDEEWSTEGKGSRITINKARQNDAVLYRGPVRNKNDNTGSIDFGIAVNKNSDKKEKVIELIKFALSDTGQSHFTSNFNSNAIPAFPVNNKIMEKRIRNASEIEDSFGNEIGLNSDIMKASVKAVKNVKKCELNRNYYKSAIIGELVEKYASGMLPKNKFIRQLNTATKFYLEE